MSAIDVEKLLQEVSPDLPCGEYLEDESAFRELLEAAKPRADQQMGEAVVEGHEPNWKDVRDRAVDLLSRTKDLRVGTELANALVHTDGLPGLGESLVLINGLLERHWEGLHPQLDPEDGNDPMERMNILAALSDPNNMVRSVRQAPLVEARPLGSFSLRDIEVATGKLTPAGNGTPPDMAVIDAAFQACELEKLQGTARALDLSIEQIQGMDGIVAGKIEAGQAPDLDPLREALKGAQQIVSEQLGRRGAQEGEVPAGAASAGAGLPAAVNTREDVIRALDKACDYFARHEPSSPVPLLLRRAKRLMSKDFMEIMQDLAPEGVKQARTITGTDPEN